MGKAEKRARKKQGRQARIEAEAKAAEKRRKRNLNIFLAAAAVVIVAIFGITRLTSKPKPKSVTTTSGTPTSTATPTPTATPTHTASPAAAAAPAPTPTSTAGGACPSVAKPAQGNHATQASPPPLTISQSKTYTATFATSCGTFVMTLDAKDSPNTVNSIVYLANKGFFNGLDFHRISRTANVIQGGDPKGDGSGGPGYTVVDPVPTSVSSGSYPSGLVAMAKTGADPAGTAGSQFFVVPGGVSAEIGPDYAVLGKVTSGLDVVTKIFNDIPAAGTSTYDGAPQVPVYIDTVTITTS